MRKLGLRKIICPKSYSPEEIESFKYCWLSAQEVEASPVILGQWPEERSKGEPLEAKRTEVRRWTCRTGKKGQEN